MKPMRVYLLWANELFACHLRIKLSLEKGKGEEMRWEMRMNDTKRNKNSTIAIKQC